MFICGEAVSSMHTAKSGLSSSALLLSCFLEKKNQKNKKTNLLKKKAEKKGKKNQERETREFKCA